MVTTVIFLISFDTIGRTFRNSMDNQEKLNFVAKESLATSIKSSLVFLFLLSQFFGGIGNHSTIGINSATLLLEGLQEDDPTYEAYPWEEKFTATKIVDGFLDSRKAIVAGLTLNIFLFFSFAERFILILGGYYSLQKVSEGSSSAG